MAASPRGLRLLSLDGGGVKGLSELLILERLMYVLKEESATYTTIPKPCEVFDIICGTSTGGLIAILLGRLELSVREAIVEYERLSKEIVSISQVQIRWIIDIDVVSASLEHQSRRCLVGKRSTLQQISKRSSRSW